MNSEILFNVFIFLAAACIVVPIANFCKFGSVLGYLAAGVLIGPFGLGFIHKNSEIMHFAEFGVIMTLFVIGLDLEPTVLWRRRNVIMGLGGLQIMMTGIVIFIAITLLGYDWRISLVAGLALSLSSTALVLQILQEKNLLHTALGETAFAVLLFQDIAVIPILILIPLLATHSTSAEIPDPSLLSDFPGWIQALIVTFVIGVMVISGRFLSNMFHFVANNNQREVFTATSLMLVVGITLLMLLIGVSPALGAFIAGVVLANSRYKRMLEMDIEPFKGLLVGLFFISVGLGMNFTLLAAQPVNIFICVLALIAIKSLILFILGRWFELGFLQNIGFMLVLSQGGEFAFVLFQYAGGLNIITPDQTALLTLIVTLSMAITPLLILGYNHFITPHFMSRL